MALFVSAANGQPAGRAGVGPRKLQRDKDGELFFLALSSGTHAALDDRERKSLLESSLFAAFQVVWDHYADDPERKSILARILAFCSLMERSRGALLERWTMPTEQGVESVLLHPAVVEALACIPLSDRGALSDSAFMKQIQECSDEVPGLQEAEKLTASAKGQNGSARVWPAGKSEMAGLIRLQKWSETSMGPVEGWPQRLKTSIDLVLACSFPMIVLWSPDLCQFYNDAYRDLMGGKHPSGLGQPTRLCWPEVWHINEPVYTKVFNGESLTFEDQLFPIRRYGYLEEAYFTLCYSPVRDEASAIQGVLVTVFETTSRAKLGMSVNEGTVKSRDEWACADSPEASVSGHNPLVPLA